MSTCKIAVLRRDSMRSFAGDCIESFDLNVYLGKMVEPVGGAYVIIEITNADKDHETVKKLTKQWEVLNPEFDPEYDPDHEFMDSPPEYIPHELYDREFFL